MTSAPSAPAARRNLYVTVAMVFVVFTGFAFVLPFLPLFVRELGVAEPERAALWAGVLIGVAPLLAGLLAPLWGRLADRHGQKRIAVKALVAYVVLLALSAAVTSVGQLFALRVGVGLFGGIGPLGLAMATALAPREETGRAVGLVQAAQILVGGDRAARRRAAGRHDRHPAHVPGDGGALRARARAARGLLRGEAPATGLRRRRHARGFARSSALPGVAALLVVLFLVNFIGRSFTPILPLHLASLGLGEDRLASATGVLISAYSIAAAASAWGLGRLSRYAVPPRAAASRRSWAAPSLVAPMALVPRFEQVLALAVLLGLAAGGSLTLCYTIGGLMVPEAVRTTAFGFFSAAALFGGALSPSVAGLVAHLSLLGIYFVDAALYLLLAAALVVRGRALGGRVSA